MAEPATAWARLIFDFENQNIAPEPLARVPEPRARVGTPLAQTLAAT